MNAELVFNQCEYEHKLIDAVKGKKTNVANY